MTNIAFANLEKTLSDLERDWRAKFGGGAMIPPFVRPSHHIQYFALDSTTQNKELPVVILVGINYTQGKTTIPDQEGNSALNPAVASRQNGNLRTRLQAAYTHRATNDPEWRNCALAPEQSPIPGFPDEYHLVLANLSPWITTVMWESEMCSIAPARGGNLLASPPYMPKHLGWPYDHLVALRKGISAPEAWWIGHGRGAVWPRWHSINRELGVSNWMLIGNVFAQTFKPSLRHDRTVKFA